MIDYKLDLETLNKICPEGYFMTTPATWVSDDGEDVKQGIGYIMCEHLNVSQKDALRTYPNVKLSVVRHRYARELIYDMVFIGR